MKESTAWGASLAALIGYGLATLAPGLPMPIVYPRLGLVAFAPIHGEPGILWYGYLAYGLLGGAIGAVVGRALPRGKHGWQAVWIAGVLLLLLLAWHERGWLA